jgi:hypothetical protein
MGFLHIKDSTNVLYKIAPKSLNFQQDNLQTLPEPEELSFKIAFIISLDRSKVANSLIHIYGI